MTLISLVKLRITELEAEDNIAISREKNNRVKSHLSQFKNFSNSALRSITEAISVINYVRSVDPQSDICKNTSICVENLKERIRDFPESLSDLLNDPKIVTGGANSDLANLKREVASLWKNLFNKKLDQLSYSLLDLFDLIPKLENNKSNVQSLRSKIEQLGQLDTPKDADINNCKVCFIEVEKLVKLLNNELPKPIQDFLIRVTKQDVVLTDLVTNTDLLPLLTEHKLTSRLTLKMKPADIIQSPVVNPWRRTSR